MEAKIVKQLGELRDLEKNRFEDIEEEGCGIISNTICLVKKISSIRY